MTSQEAIKLIKADGWYEVAVKGSHHQFKHPSKPGRVTITHPKKDLPAGTFNSILKQAGLK
ncbi:type II toxin-antitoxin system HicA family toxin [Andreprevotia chitinilytica]|uniref:type II toxin-antitoxin system HicA family toxin n=1 Tax=Andreprevotia chitinilytica TaxID=396808 RepID=UPI000558215F|nr:type II toxin-antitoxin system HicA family toxin [Andreprevotia chitinilytica]